MPTARRASPTRAWPSPLFFPPTLARLAQPSSRLSDAPASIRHRDLPPPPFGATTSTARGATTVRYNTLQEESDALDSLEDDTEHQGAEIKEFGHSWLIPLGRQNTHDEDEGSQFSTSPALGSGVAGAGAGNHHNTSLELPLPPAFEVDPAQPELAQPTRTNPAPVSDRDEAEEGGPVIDLDAEIEDADLSESGSDLGTASDAASAGGQQFEGSPRTSENGTEREPRTSALGERQERSFD